MTKSYILQKSLRTDKYGYKPPNKENSTKYQKSCPRCQTKNCIRFGMKRGKQRYQCKNCMHIFCNASRKSHTNDSTNKIIYTKWALNRQTYKNLASEYHLSERTIQKKIQAFSASLSFTDVSPCPIVLIIDTTYFGRGLGIMAFKRADINQIIKIKLVENESAKTYQQGIEELKTQGWIIRAIVCDGKKGLLGGFQDIPTQMCQFHQIKIITRYLTRKPLLEPNRALRYLALQLAHTDKESFTYWLDMWYQKYSSFIQERTYYFDEHGEKKGYHYTHKKTRSAYLSLKRNLPYLFVFYDYMHILSIPNTTNGLEGGVFSHLKEKVMLHRGLKKERKLQLIFFLLHILPS